MMSQLARDVRYALRQIRRAPGFSAIVILTLALGIGANAAIFSVVNGLLLRPLPYADPDRLVEINHFYPSLDNMQAPISAAGYRDYREKLTDLEGVAVQGGWGVNLTGDGEPERLTGALVSPNYFGTLGVAPALGRGFQPDEAVPGADRVAVLSDGLWRRRFGADPGVLGRAITLNGQSYTVVGVMPRGFRPFFNAAAEVFAPLALTEEQYNAGYTNEYLRATARLAPGVTLEQARAETAGFADQLKQASPEQFGPRWTIKLTPLNERARGDIRPALLVLLGAVGFVLLIACANVANLLLARGASRAREIAVRLALGARSGQLLRQLLTESVVLSTIGGAAGTLLAFVAVRAFVAANPASLPRIELIRLSAPVVGFALLVTLATAVLFGLLPALHSARSSAQQTLREGGRGLAGDRAGGLIRRGLIVIEFALALALLAGSALLIKSFARLTSVDPGFNPHHLLTFNIALPTAKYPTDTAQIQFFDRLLERLAATPGVEAAGATSVLPFSGGWSTASFQVEGYEPGEGEPGPWGDIRVVSPDFARTMGIRLLRGRFLTDADRLGADRAVVVDEEMVRRYWSDREPLDQRISFDGENWFPVVGVVAHAAHEGLDADARVQLYFPYRSHGRASLFVVVRTRGEPTALVGAVRSIVGELDPDQPIARMATMEQLMADTVGPRRFAALLLAAFAAIAMLLAAIGIYGVISFMVSQRAKEMGVRMAIGAGRSAILADVLRRGLGLAGLGVLLGGLGSMWLTQLLQSQLYRVRPDDPAVFALVAAILVGVAAAATLVPAIRATRVDPAIALRAE